MTRSVFSKRRPGDNSKRSIDEESNCSTLSDNQLYYDNRISPSKIVEAWSDNAEPKFEQKSKNIGDRSTSGNKAPSIDLTAIPEDDNKDKLTEVSTETSVQDLKHAPSDEVTAFGAGSPVVGDVEEAHVAPAVQTVEQTQMNAEAETSIALSLLNPTNSVKPTSSDDDKKVAAAPTGSFSLASSDSYGYDHKDDDVTLFGRVCDKRGGAHGNSKPCWRRYCGLILFLLVIFVAAAITIPLLLVDNNGRDKITDTTKSESSLYNFNDIKPTMNPTDRPVNTIDEAIQTSAPITSSPTDAPSITLGRFNPGPIEEAKNISSELNSTTFAPVTPINSTTLAPVTSHAEDTPALASCSANAQCMKENLIGDCCPTLYGIYLDCCAGTNNLSTPPAPTLLALDTNTTITTTNSTEAPTQPPTSVPTEAPSISLPSEISANVSSPTPEYESPTFENVPTDAPSISLPSEISANVSSPTPEYESPTFENVPTDAHSISLPNEISANVSSPNGVSPVSEYESQITSLVKTVTPEEILLQATSPQANALTWLLEESEVPLQSEEQTLQRYALAVLGGTNLNPLKHVCQWNGITCNGASLVTKLVWPESGLSGNIPAEVGLLQNLVYLDLAENDLQGPLPDELFTLTDLTHLYLHQNQLSGSLSERFSELEKLTHFYGGNNLFSGHFPRGLGSKGVGGANARPLRYLSLHKNQLSGPLPENMNLRHLFYLDLSSNQFYGLIPRDWSAGPNRLTVIRHLYLDHNTFQGNLDPTFPQMGNSRIAQMFLSDNLFTGPFPGNWLNHDHLQQFEIQNTGFTSIPREVCQQAVFVSGEVTNLRADCAICDCLFFCDNCYY